jgi:hydroxyacylglutathione hydrolase
VRRVARGAPWVSDSKRRYARNVEVTIVPCRKDNYAYFLRPEGGDTVALVDASEAGPILKALGERGLNLGAILSTHHHRDHVEGNEELVAHFPGIPVYGSAHDRGRIPEQTHFVSQGDVIDVVGLHLSCLLVPGHTLGAVAYVGHGAVFTGDTLFAGGCGRLFEGTPRMMYDALNVTLAALPDETLVYCGHEYTAKNLEFAAAVEPGNRAVAERAERVRRKREHGEPSIPSTMAEERATNPYLRVTSGEIRARYRDRIGNTADPAAVLGALRAEKDAF